MTTPLSLGPAWRALAEHQSRIAAIHLRDLFATDTTRATRHTIESAGVTLDYSRHRFDHETLTLFSELHRQQCVSHLFTDMVSGLPVNLSENRPALHTALRASFPGRSPTADAARRAADEARARCYDFAQMLRNDAARASVSAIHDVVNLGVGGSDLGPRATVRALRSSSAASPRVHFVANADPADLDAVLATLNPRHTLFIIASKTFTTVETLSNARRARQWLADALGNTAAGERFAAVTAQTERARAWGVDKERIFPVWDWVGGRFSLWSAMGLPAMIAIGPRCFDELLAGARAMDEHALAEPPEKNMPIVMALLSVWYSAFFGAQSHAILPYAEDLREFPGWVQQLHMESNGKGVTRHGQAVPYQTAPIVWGASGTVSQHSFHQLLHQGTRLVPVDFIVPVFAGGDAAAQRMLVANALAQGSALLTGDNSSDPHRHMPGNRPSSTLLLERLDARSLGALFALYEHKVVAEAALLDINAFDQWGVEYGKRVAQAIETDQSAEVLDPSTRQLLLRVQAMRAAGKDPT